MTKRHPDDPKPTWFRLSAESWAMIRTEYLNGATARALAKKYRVSPTSIYRHACQEGWTKEAMAEAVSRKSVADAERVASEEAAANKQCDDEMHALVEQIASEEDASGIGLRAWQVVDSSDRRVTVLWRFFHGFPRLGSGRRVTGGTASSARVRETWTGAAPGSRRVAERRREYPCVSF